jgi:1-acyl-sn-glycerol-3-phosphate acyltransferase
MAQVIRMPIQRSDAAARSTAADAVGSPGWLTGWDIDDWGRDDTLAGFAARLGNVRWDATVGGADALPKRGPALIVINSRRFALAPWFVSLALSQRTGRPVRFVGRPDVAPFGALARRLGGLLARPDEVRGALRHGQVLVVGASGALRDRHVGSIDHRLIGPAVEEGVSVIPGAVTMSFSTRNARIEIGRPIKPSRRRRGPLAEFELTAQVADRIDEMLSEFGDARTGTPLDWLPFNPLGGN